MDVDTVVILSIDALNAGHLPCYGYDRDTAPFLSELAAENTVFENCYSVSSHTREAMPSMLSGQFPIEAVDEQYKLSVSTVASHLDGPTAMFHSNPFISRAYGYGGDFDTFHDDLLLSRNRLLALGKRAWDKLVNDHYSRAPAINERSQQWLDTQPAEETLLWNHYMDVHGPYEPPAEYREFFGGSSVSSRRSQLLLRKAKRKPDRLTESEQQTLVDRYDGEIRYIDAQIRRFVDWLESSGRIDNTLLVLTADHGEGLGSEGFYEHPRRLTDGLLHVPMILAGPTVPARRIRTPTSVRTIPATILDALGGDPDHVPGCPLTIFIESDDSERDSTVFAQVSHKRASTFEFYARGLDGAAKIVLDAETGEQSRTGDREGLAALDEHIAEQETEKIERRETRPDDSELAGRLQSLGYLE